MKNAPGAKKPEDISKLFLKHTKAKNLDGLVGLYEDDAVLVTLDSKQIKGRDAITKNMREHLSRNPAMTVGETNVTASGDVALLHIRWNYKGTRPSGEKINFSRTSTDVLRRQDDGTWRIVINRPGGAETP